MRAKGVVFFFCLVAVVLGFSPAAFSGGRADALRHLPIYYYWTGEAPYLSKAGMVDSWNLAWNWRARLNGRRIRNCDDFEKALAGKPFTFEVARKIEQPLWCAVVSAVSRMARPRRALFDPERLGEEIYQHLDMSSLHWGDLDVRLGQRGLYTLAQLGLKAVRTDKNQVSIYTDEGEYDISVITMADFEGDGGQQIYCELTFQDGKTNKIIEYAALLTRETKGGTIIAKPLYVKKPVRFGLSDEILKSRVYVGP